MTPEAICFHRVFEPAGAAEFRMDRHYLLYASEGTLRLEADGQSWTLPPARAAFIPAGQSVMVSIRSRLVSASVLFAPDHYSGLPEGLTVFDMSPLARELIAECLLPQTEAGPLAPYAKCLFDTLAVVVSRLAENPSLCVLPLPRSAPLLRALTLTQEQFAGKPDFETIARATGQSSRSLARRFAEEMGITWRDTLRRIRVIHAVELLAASDRAITDIALDVGYGSVSAFNAAFRAVMGKTPSEYRTTFR